MIQLLLNQLLVLLTLGLFSGLFQLSNFDLLEVQWMKLSYQTKVLSSVKILLHHSLTVSKIFNGEKNCEISSCVISRI